MLDKICIRHQKKTDAETAIDLGFLAEAMIFYQQVHVIADWAMLRQLIFNCGPDLLLELLECNYLSLTYLTNDVAIQTTNTNTIYERHEPIVFSMPNRELQEVAPKLFTEATGRSGRGRRMAKRSV